jgi:hypothetical protein
MACVCFLFFLCLLRTCGPPGVDETYAFVRLLIPPCIVHAVCVTVAVAVLEHVFLCAQGTTLTRVHLWCVTRLVLPASPAVGELSSRLCVQEARIAP